LICDSRLLFLSGAVTTVTWDNLNMHRSSTTWLGLGVLIALACGAPAELDDNQFPGAYTGDETGTSGGQLMGTPSAATPPVNNAPAPATGSVVAPPAAPVAGNDDGGDQSTPLPGGEAPPANGAGAPAEGGSAPASGAGAPPAVAGGGACPDDITLLFNRPIEVGGCAGGACHVPGATAPDLVSPNPEARLVGVTSQCEQRPYIGPDDSFLAEKIVGTPACGFAMPFFAPEALTADDEACILAWIDEVSGG
jgi:hypothetical protein